MAKSSSWTRPCSNIVHIVGAVKPWAVALFLKGCSSDMPEISKPTTKATVMAEAVATNTTTKTAAAALVSPVFH